MFKIKTENTEREFKTVIAKDCYVDGLTLLRDWLNIRIYKVAFVYERNEVNESWKLLHTIEF